MIQGMAPELRHGFTTQGQPWRLGSSLSHLLGNIEDLRRSSSLSGLGSRFSSCSGWMDAELNRVRAINSPRKPWLKGEAEPPRKRARPAGLGPWASRPGLFLRRSCSPFLCGLLASSRVYVLHVCAPWDVVIFEISSSLGLG
jgi:hypothetical protein